MPNTRLCLECGKPQDTGAICGRCGGQTVSRETLADLAHRLWMHWSQHIAAEEHISADRQARWGDLWTDYDELSEEMKDTDRELVEEMLRNKRHPEEVWE